MLVAFGSVDQEMSATPDVTTQQFIEQAKARFSITSTVAGWRLIRDDDASEVPDGVLLDVLRAHPGDLPTDLILVLAPRVWRYHDLPNVPRGEGK